MTAILFFLGPTNKYAWVRDILLLGNRSFHWQPASMSALVHSDLAASVLGCHWFETQNATLSVPGKIIESKHYLFFVPYVLVENFIVLYIGANNALLSAYCILKVLHVASFKCHCPHFVEKDTEAQNSSAMSPRSGLGSWSLQLKKRLFQLRPDGYQQSRKFSTQRRQEG